MNSKTIGIAIFVILPVTLALILGEWTRENPVRVDAEGCRVHLSIASSGQVSMGGESLTLPTLQARLGELAERHSGCEAVVLVGPRTSTPRVIRIAELLREQGLTVTVDPETD